MVRDGRVEGTPASILCLCWEPDLKFSYMKEWSRREVAQGVTTRFSCEVARTKKKQKDELPSSLVK